MSGVKYIYWEDDGYWVGYLEEYPDYQTQGHSLKELQENLRDIYIDITGGKVPGVRHVAELPLS